MRNAMKPMRSMPAFEKRLKEHRLRAKKVWRTCERTANAVLTCVWNGGGGLSSGQLHAHSGSGLPKWEHFP